MKKSADLEERTPRPRDRKTTEEELRSAILQVKEKGLKLSITAVAAKVGVSPSLIHNTYPELAEKIRGELGRTSRQQRDVKAAELVDARAALKHLREELRATKRDLDALASINESLRDENACLRGEASGKVKVLARRNGGQRSR